MGIYWRSRGEVRLAKGGTRAAIADLETGTTINRADTLTLRSLALAYLQNGQRELARVVADRAVNLERSDTDNVVLKAYVERVNGNEADAQSAVIEALQQDPLLVADNHWGRIVDPLGLDNLVRSAAESYGSGSGSPVGVGAMSLNATFLATFAHQPRLMSIVKEEVGEGLLGTAQTVIRGGFCSPDDVLRVLDDAPGPTNGNYWALRLIFEGLAGKDRSQSAVLASLQAPGMGELTHGELSEEALQQRAPDVDVSGYGRIRLPIVITPELPTPVRAANLWLAHPVLVVDRLASIGIAECHHASRRASQSAVGTH
jgi:hypothetical protein